MIDNSEAIKKICQKLLENEEITNECLDLKVNDVHAALLALKAKQIVDFLIEPKIMRILTAEGKEVLKNGSREFNVYQKVKAEEKIEMEKVDAIGKAFAFKNGWIEKCDEVFLKVKKNIKVSDSVAEKLSKLDEISTKEFDGLKKRKLCETVKKNLYYIKRGANFGKEEKEEIRELTVENMNNESAEFLNSFKKYNFNSTGILPHCGSLHPLMKMRSEIKKIFIEMGFSEMETNRYVESSFWNFDSLFQPQNHPSRDAHDTFFLSNPRFDDLSQEDKEYIEKVRKIHSVGNEDSLGHFYNWDIEEAKKNILRTHTTAVSSRHLYKIAQKIKSEKGEFKPVKLFSVDKVFRNETVDATHLAEFHQVEGLIMGKNIGLSDLMGVLSTFFSKLGISQIKFKPAFNPYTEPSMEVFGYHNGLKKWIEIGNSGIFRPEMLEPMGFDKDVTVIAWGLSLERPAMIKYQLNNIRELVGHKVDINFIRDSEIVYFK